MFQPLADIYSQPVAVFASRGPVVGTELAKLMLKCIILLEQAGAEIIDCLIYYLTGHILFIKPI